MVTAIANWVRARIALATARYPALARGREAGINGNDLGLRDPTRTGISVWVDPISGSAVRQGLPARLRRLAT